jgi:hypothetical protein
MWVHKKWRVDIEMYWKERKVHWDARMTGKLGEMKECRMTSKLGKLKECRMTSNMGRKE